MRRRRTSRASARRAPACARSCRSTRATAYAISSRCAAICRRARRRPASFTTRTSSSSSYARSSATTSSSKSRLIPNTIRRRAARRRICKLSGAKSKPARIRRSRSISSTRTAYFHFVDECEAMGLDSADRARHHADRTLLTARALLRCVRRGDPALDPQEARRLRRRYRVDPRVRARRRDAICAIACCASGAPGLHFYTLNQAGLTTAIWQRLGL